MSSKTGFIYHDRFLDHDTGAGHPERPERLRAIVSRLRGGGLWKDLQHPMIDEAAEEWILTVHTPAHLKYVREACAAGRKILDGGDTHASAESYGVAMLAAGGVLAGADGVMKGLLRNAFCAIRPPGHHAEKGEVMGFCLFNNVAVAARYAQKEHGAGKIAIIDWDVHHGNGTQHIFYEDPSVFYISLHQYPYYPGTGSKTEKGEGRGEGATLNIPMSAGSGEREYLDAFKDEIIPALETYRPDLIIISAGFDAHRDDPLANIELTEDTFAKMTVMVRGAAEALCGGRILSVLEGGYDLNALSASVDAHLRCLVKP